MVENETEDVEDFHHNLKIEKTENDRKIHNSLKLHNSLQQYKRC